MSPSVSPLVSTPPISHEVPKIKEEPKDPLEIEQVDVEDRQIVLNIGNHLVEDPYEFDDIAQNDDFGTKNDHFGNKSETKKKQLVDVTDKYNEEEDDITCGICLGYDPPLPTDEVSAKKKKDSIYTTSWVGCDCGTWYHKQCTTLKAFRATFTCKSVKRKCQK